MENSSRSFLNLYKFSKKHIKNKKQGELFLIDEKKKLYDKRVKLFFYRCSKILVSFLRSLGRN